MSIEITSTGFENNEQVLQYIKDNLDAHHKEMLHLLGETIVSEARSNLQNNTNISTGTLHASIMILDEGDDYIVVGTLEDYAGYIEYGRGPVRPLKEGGWLHWIDKSSGKDVFAKFANATEPSPFMEPAVTSMTLNFPEIYAEKTNEMIS
jgi:phage gpG-like protein